jgi:hypothetical protein
MARTITYRVKTPAGEWQRAVIDDTALPQNITGLVAGETYEVDTGKGTLVDVTPLNTFTLEVFTGTPVVTGPGEYELTVTAPAYLAAYNPGGGAGVYTWDTTELATGPKVLYPGSINAASYNVGNTISLVNPAFGVGSGTVDVFYRVYDDGVEIYDGATLAFDTTGIVAASSVSVRAYMVDQNGESAEATILTFTIGAASSPISRLATTRVITSGTTNQSSFTSSGVTAQSGSNRCAVLIVASRAISGVTGFTATWGASNFEFIGFSGVPVSDHSCVAMFIMREANIPAGSNTITVSPTGANTNRCVAHLVEYSGVNQTTPAGTGVGTTGPGGNTVAALSLTVNMTSTLSLMVSSVASNSGTASPFTLSAGTEIFDTFQAGTISVQGAEQLVGATGNNTHTHTASATQQMGAYGFELYRA